MQLLRAGGLPDPLARVDFGARVLDITVLVFREGLECILVVAALTANMVGTRRAYQKPVAAGLGLGVAATLATWLLAVRIIDSLTESIPALEVQAATGLLAIVVLLVVMNWFFHKVYWTGWICMHSRRKQELIRHQRLTGRVGGDSRCSGSRRFIAKALRSSSSSRAIGCAWAPRPLHMVSPSVLCSSR